MTGLQAAGALAVVGLFASFAAAATGRDDTAIVLLVLFSIPLVLRLLLMAMFN